MLSRAAALAKLPLSTTFAKIRMFGAVHRALR
jgi:hypothetical protein